MKLILMACGLFRSSTFKLCCLIDMRMRIQDNSYFIFHVHFTISVHFCLHCILKRSPSFDKFASEPHLSPSICQLITATEALEHNRSRLYRQPKVMPKPKQSYPYLNLILMEMFLLLYNQNNVHISYSYTHTATQPISRK